MLACFYENVNPLSYGNKGFKPLYYGAADQT